MSERSVESRGTGPGSVGGAPDGNGRLIAMAAGDLLQTMRRETRSILRQAQGDRFGAMKLGLTRLRNDGFIAPADLRRLQTSVDAVRAAARKPDATDEVLERIRAAYHALVVDRRSSAVAVAIASLANSVVTPTKAADADGTPTLSLVSVRPEAGRAIQGAIVGALLGAVIGGPAGAVSGATVGGNAGAKSSTSS